ncbi:MAG: alkaline phosphatase family protein [Saprospiraceae bacterium]|nr:alkaline phosphatase family protein [Saprospiraceae bacterium]
MKERILQWTLLLLCVALMTPAMGQQKERKALFIGIDGVRSDALQQANTPNIDALTQDGLYSYDSWHLGVTSSGPSWSSMLTGVWEAKHLVTNNSYSGANFGEYPYLSNPLKEWNPDLKCVQVFTWNPQGEVGENSGGNVFNSNWDTSIDAGDLGQGLVKETAKLQLLDPELDFLFIHFDETDSAGHGFGFSPNVPQYMNAIEGADAEIGEVINALRNRATYDNEEWLIVSTTDHGGQGFGHGGNSNNERLIWWYASSELLPSTEIPNVGDPGSYQMPTNPVDPELLEQVPVLTDIAVTVLDWMITDMTGEEIRQMWDLDGKSWLPAELSVVTTSTQNQLAALPSFRVFPNPVTGGQFNIAYNALPEQTNVTVRNTLGQQLFVTQVAANTPAKIQIEAGRLQKGIYFVEVQEQNSGKKYIAQKLVIQ